jgi:hypothetical protein
LNIEKEYLKSVIVFVTLGNGPKNVQCFPWNKSCVYAGKLYCLVLDLLLVAGYTYSVIYEMAALTHGISSRLAPPRKNITVANGGPDAS